ncbi:L-amino-acid oxidase [Strix uralensis]|uniref:L-amino-acid oxidase n=1 Tax=Strix uralensis TaxID=36305 RepID=UPI003DA78152
MRDLTDAVGFLIMPADLKTDLLDVPHRGLDANRLGASHLPPGLSGMNLHADCRVSLLHYFLLSLVLFQILLLVGVLSAKRISSFPDYCLGDEDYEELLKIAKNGLGRATHPAKVVIVGAGISGLTAAKLLQDAGHKVTILESSNQLGGRIRTYRPKGQDWYVELGAMRLPGSHRIVREFIRQFKLPLNPFNLSDNKTWYLINGTRARAEEVNKNPDILKYDVKPTERGKNAEQLYREVLNKAVQHFKSMDCEEYLDLYDSYSTKEYLIKVGNLSRGAVQMIGDIMNEDSGFYLSFLSSLWHFRIFSNESFDEITGGFDQLPKAFQKSLSDPIKFDCTVEKIVREGNEVHVFYRAPGTLDPTIVADYVLVTSTTKATRLIQFQPPLSPPKTHALRSTHYASSTKIALACTYKFWEKDGIRGGYSITDRPSRFIYYPSHNFSTGVGVILASYTWNDDAEFFAALTGEKCLDVVLQDLSVVHQVSKEELQKNCSQYVIEKWQLDRHSMGAFAAFTPYQFTDYSQALFEHEGRVYFSGEHTAHPHAWIETSMKSAIRAAKAIDLDSRKVHVLNEEEEQQQLRSFLQKEDL